MYLTNSKMVFPNVVKFHPISGENIHQAISPNKPRFGELTDDPESYEEASKRKHIEQILMSENSPSLDVCKSLAFAKYGLVNDTIRKKIWPVLAGIDMTKLDQSSTTKNLETHPEYQQIILDVNRSLKRFPPGIPYDQRIALQDQLTALILSIIQKYPSLRYYQGYHDVAITFLLVVGKTTAIAVMEKLSTTHFEECMQETMDATQRRLMFIYPIIRLENHSLYTFLRKSSVGVLFCLPWFLTWFGHSLNSYNTVVRLYDYFLAAPIHSSIYVTAAIILHRTEDILKAECDMASLHCLLSNLPDDLPFEELLCAATQLSNKYPIESIANEVDDLLKYEQQQNRNQQKASADNTNLIKTNRKIKKLLSTYFPLFLTKKYFVTTAFSIVFGICVYYYKAQYYPAGVS